MILINELIATITATSRLYVESLRKDLTNKHVHPWFTTSIPNIIGHPIIFLFLALFVGITFPKNPLFYIAFFMVGFLALISFYFKLKGFTKSLFSSCIALGATAPFFKAIGGVFF